MERLILRHILAMLKLLAGGLHGYKSDQFDKEMESVEQLIEGRR